MDDHIGVLRIALRYGINHEIRLVVLQEAAQGQIAAKWITERHPAFTLGSVAYHVRELHKARLLKRVKTIQVRGAIQTVYALSAEGRRVWEKLTAHTAE